MKRLQISIEPELDSELDRAARAEGISKAEVVRRCVRRQIRPLPPIGEDPLFRLFGTAASEPDDDRSIDDVVYGPRE